MDYALPKGCHVIPEHLLDLRSDAEIDHDLQNPKPVFSEKNIWFFWHSGFENMHGYTQRNVRAWHRRFSRLGWTIRVLDRLSSSPLNVANFLDEQDPETFPKAFIDGTLGGTYPAQHTSDLVRWPLLNKYGGVYADVGMIQIGNLDRLWNETIANPSSPLEVLSYNMGPGSQYALTNYFLCSAHNNRLFTRCHKLFLALWNADGGKTSTEGMHASPLLKGTPLLGKDDNMSFTENDRYYGPEEVSKMLTDYITQGQANTMVMGTVDDEDSWDGPHYVTEHVFAVEYMVGSQLINELTAWDGHKAFHLMSLHLPKDGEKENEEQSQAREIVEACLSQSFGFKLATGLILRVHGPTLASLWRENDGADAVSGTYADWLRYGVVHWDQDQLPTQLEYERIEPFKRGPLLKEA